MKPFFLTGKEMRLSRLLMTLALLIAATSGCQKNGWEANTYPAYGTVSINGNAPEGAIVRLHPQGQAIDRRESIPWGLVDTNGTYTLRTYVQGDGAPAGEYVVTLEWPKDPNVFGSEDRLKQAYSSTKDAPFHVTIEKRSNELPPLVLDQVKVLPATKN